MHVSARSRRNKAPSRSQKTDGPVFEPLERRVLMSAVTAKAADSFVNMIGVNTHLNYGGNDAYANYAQVKADLLSLGVRHIRDQGHSAAWISDINDLHANGINLDMIEDPNNGITPNSSSAYGYRGTFNGTLVNFIKNNIPGAVESVEMLNEFDYGYSHYGWDNGYYQYNGQEVTDWAPYLRQFTLDSYAAIKADPATQNIRVIGPTLVNAASSTNAELGDLSDSVDWGGVHPYNQDPASNGALDQELWLRQHPFGTDPMAATEFGYPTAGSTGYTVSTTVQDKYTNRELFEMFNRGLTRAYPYELLDEYNQPGSREDNFGLFTNNYQPKPAAVTMSNIISLLSDKGASFTPGSLNYTLGGSLGNVHSTLLQRSNGDFYLALWQETPSSTDTDVEAPVTVTFTSTVSSVGLIHPELGTSPTTTYNNPVQISLNVPDRVMLLKITPTNSGPLSRTGWVASATIVKPGDPGAAPSKAIDSSLSTIYKSGSNQVAGQWFQVDMGQSQSVGSVNIVSDTGDYPPGSALYVSNDPNNPGQPVATTTTNTENFSLTPSSPVTGRYVRIVITTPKAGRWWSIKDLNINGAGGTNDISGYNTSSTGITALARTGWVASASVSPASDPPSQAIDGSLSTRYSTDTKQLSGMWFQVDMQSVQSFSRIKISTATYDPGDEAGAYSISVSNDGMNWGSAIYSGIGNGPIEDIVLASPLSARYIRVTLTTNKGNFWSINDFSVFD